MSIFGKLVHIARLYTWHSKERMHALKREELEIIYGIVATTNLLRNDVYNEGLQGVVNMLKNKMRGVEKWNAKRATIRSRVQWMHVGDKCLSHLFQAI